MTTTDSETPPGWAALDAALQTLYPGVTPQHFGTVRPYRMGGPDPLDGISAFFVERPTPHWHFVSYGLTELRQKESGNPKVSGFGFELTLRVAGARGESPPEWAMRLMQSLARYVYTTGRYFEQGHFFDLGEELPPEVPFRAVAFRREPQLPVSKSPYGAFEFLQIVLLQGDEVRALKAWNTLGLLDLMAKRDPLLIASASRPSILRDGAAAKELSERAAREGSSTPKLRFSSGGWEQKGKEIALTLTKDDAVELAAVLRGRLGFGRPLELFIGEAATPAVKWMPGPQAAVASEAGTLRLTVDAELARAVADSISQGSGPWRWPQLPNWVFLISGGAR